MEGGEVHGKKGYHHKRVHGGHRSFCGRVQPYDLQRKEKDPKEKKPDSAEFLSGFYRENRLLPIITVVVYFGADSWDAPRSLHEMLIVQDESILSLVPDYRINLIAPGEMSEEELEHFTSNFREVMQFIKYSKDTEKLSQLVEENTAFETMDRKAVRVMEEITGMKIEKEVEESVPLTILLFARNFWKSMELIKKI